ncbi:MAG: proline--tRNA ligase, partial [Christensenella sp.]
MAKQKDGFVEHITPQNEDFSRWYTDVIKMADMVDYSDVKGCMVIKQYGYGIWELIQRQLDDKFKETGHKNAY